MGLFPILICLQFNAKESERANSGELHHDDEANLREVVSQVSTSFQDQYQEGLFQVRRQGFQLVLNVRISNQCVVGRASTLLRNDQRGLPSDLLVLGLSFNLNEVSIRISILEVRLRVRRMERLLSCQGRTIMDHRRHLIRVEVLRMSTIRGRRLVRSLLTNDLQFTNGSKGLTRNYLGVSKRRVVVRLLTGRVRSALTRVNGPGVRRFHTVTIRNGQGLQVRRNGTLGDNGSIVRLNEVQFRRFATNEGVMRGVTREGINSREANAEFLALVPKAQCNCRNACLIELLANLRFRLYRNDGEYRDLSSRSRHARNGRVIYLASLENKVTLGNGTNVHLQRSLTVVGSLSINTAHVRRSRLGVPNTNVGDVLRRLLSSED